jgi:hypothetical protein
VVRLVHTIALCAALVAAAVDFWRGTGLLAAVKRSVVAYGASYLVTLLFLLAIRAAGAGREAPAENAEPTASKGRRQAAR